MNAPLSRLAPLPSLLITKLRPIFSFSISRTGKSGQRTPKSSLSLHQKPTIGKSNLRKSKAKVLNYLFNRSKEKKSSFPPRGSLFTRLFFPFRKRSSQIPHHYSISRPSRQSQGRSDRKFVKARDGGIHKILICLSRSPQGRIRLISTCCH